MTVELTFENVYQRDLTYGRSFKSSVLWSFLYTCMYARVFVHHVYISISVCAYTCICAHTCVYMYMKVYLITSGPSNREYTLYMHTHVCIYMYVYIHMYVKGVQEQFRPAGRCPQPDNHFKIV